MKSLGTIFLCIQELCFALNTGINYRIEWSKKFILITNNNQIT